ncbi:hypothetical protein [Cellulomonas oligotrophica]|uniref:Peptide chain release factor 1 n=1 Tax=Cellulomonas oligotrophica TaxID=931536 RepID=A0A7Y9FJ99_9CELL|nr:hypothetical protein [Cellulomonas oligotrophica]NYD88017.1 hypothetical protein [Cellulomonas oligotrophica]GIG34514.1 hypothetical protein Col01nite_36730 [Cellulomonas oligotrophica]
MHLHWLKPLLGRPAPFTTVHIDASPAEAAGESELLDRWRAVRRGLEHDGAPAAVLDEIAERLSVPDGRRTAHGRVVVADAHGVVVDRVVAEPPARSQGVHGPVPSLIGAVRAADETLCYLLVEVDRTGADLTWVEAGEEQASPSVTETVEGGHDDVHKTRDGLARRGQTRAEDSWQRNAEAVAAAVDARVRTKTPDLVLLTGDVRAVALVKDAVGQHVAERLVEVSGGGRGEGVHRDAFDERVAHALAEQRSRRRAAELDRYREGLGRGEGAVTSLGDVVEVLRRGQVAELVLGTEALSALDERTLVAGPEPLQLGLDEEDLAAMGVNGQARRFPAHVALLRAAIGQDAGVTFAEDGDVDLVDGVGAVLRWADGSTPSEAVPSQSADQKRLRQVV